MTCTGLALKLVTDCGGDGFKAVVKDGYAHARECSDRLEIEALSVVVADPSHGLSDVHQARVRSGNLTEQAAMRSHQQPKHELVFQGLSHDGDFGWAIEKLH